MRFLSRKMPPFGPFTDVSIDLSGGTKGLHIIHGPNEAGKSVSLRALKSALFGIQERTTDNFLHDNTKLRVGAHIRRADGKELRFVRRKGRKNTLLAADNQTVLQESELGKFLQGLTAELFASLFAIDHEELLRGGRQIAEGQGDLGQSLFAAGMGTANLKAVLDSLGAEAEELFRPGGSKPVINAAIRAYKDRRAESTQAALSGRDWQEKQNELQRIAAEIERVGREIGTIDVKHTQLGRLQQAIPLLDERRDAENALAAMGKVVILRSAFQQDRLNVQEGLQDARRRQGRAEEDLANVRKNIGELSVPQELLQQAEPIAQLHQRSGEYSKGNRDLPKLERDQRRLREDAAIILAQVAPGVAIEDAASMCPTAAKKAGIRDLGSEFQKLRQKSETMAGKAE